MAMAIKLGRMVAHFDELLSIKSHDLLITWHTKAITSLLPQYLYGHQSWKDGDLLWGWPTHKVIQSFGHVISEGHVTNENLYIFTKGVPIATKLGSMMNCLYGLLYKVR